MNNNVALNEFIIKYSEFWSLLSTEQQDLIKTYVYNFGDLEVFDIIEYDKNAHLFMYNEPVKYLYLGQHEATSYIMKYYYECKFDVLTHEYNLKDGTIINVTIEKENKKKHFICD